MESIRNIAIIAHVDHGKTTLVDKIMYHCQLFRDNENTGDLILDNNDLERELWAQITVHDSHRIISLGQFSDQAAMALSGLFMIQFRKASNPTLNQDFSFRP